MERNGASGTALGWIFTALASVATLGYVLLASIVPGLLGRPVAAGTPLSLGLVLGLGLVVFLVILAVAYTHRMNRRP